ncbi:hypothetical protein [Myxacorys almedinensis]|uniref:Uncharacterized protein n=1 Tax=Myxacorys almedinensis A TaxID=2690445 RepID=A0A8J7YWJ2_9CYAN|nr:hypothetical protein [Myxacorys almedinensis]NDJ15929.1 hypothetical protein [Myxacorys almedinensis A]
MSRTFDCFLGFGCLFLSTCSLFVVGKGNCAVTIRMALITELIVAIAIAFLWSANEKPVGVWVTMYRLGLFIGAIQTVIVISRIVNALQGIQC